MPAECVRVREREKEKAHTRYDAAASAAFSTIVKKERDQKNQR
jgi:hypothetical protein